MTPNDVKIVAENIDDFIEVSNSVARLRSAIFALAISGKFAPTGSDSWRLSTLGEVCSVRKGKKPELYDAEDNGMLPYLEAKFIRGTKSAKFAKVSDKNSVIVTKGDLIIICDGSNSGEFFTGVHGVLASTMGIITYDKRTVSKEYLEVFLEGNFELFNKARKGAAIPHLDFNLFNSLPFSLPSIEEQKRIVKKVEEVMKKLDELETKKLERDDARSRLARSAMQSLGKGESKIAFEHLTELIKTPGDIKELEGALLTLAVSGKLVPQDTKDEYSQAKLTKNGEAEERRKKVRVFSEIKAEDVPFEIPKSWRWVRFGSVFTDYSSGSTPSRGKDVYYNNGHMNWYKSGELNDGVLSYDAEEKITDSALAECHLRLNKPGDLLIAMYGATAGRVAMLANKGTTNQAVWGGTPDKSADLKYLFFYILQSRHQLLKTSSGAAQPNISGEKISSHVLALPTLAEQERIVKKIGEIMLLIKNLNEIIGSDKTSGRGRPRND